MTQMIMKSSQFKILEVRSFNFLIKDIYKDCSKYVLTQFLQCFLEFFIMSIMMISAYSPKPKDSFIIKHYYNTLVGFYQFQMFLAKFTLFFFVIRKIFIYPMLQFAMSILVFLMVYFCKFCDFYFNKKLNILTSGFLSVFLVLSDLLLECAWFQLPF